MGIFGKLGKQKQPDVSEFGRRRPGATDASSQRPQAFSYYAQRSTQATNTGRGTTTETEARKAIAAGPQKWYQNRYVVLAGGLVVLGGFLYLMTLSATPRIVRVVRGGSSYFMQDDSVYQQAATLSLESSLFNKSKLTLNGAKVNADLTAQYPEIRTAIVTAPLFGHQPVVSIEPYQPSCILTTTASTAYLLDTNGRALVSASQISDAGELSVPTVNDKSGLEIKLGSQALPVSTVQFIRQLVAILDAAKVRYGALTLPPAASELDVAIGGKPYMVKFNLQGDAKEQGGTFLATKERLEHDKVMPAQYIDVRVPGRAYYQ